MRNFGFRAWIIGTVLMAACAEKPGPENACAPCAEVDGPYSSPGAQKQCACNHGCFSDFPYRCANDPRGRK